MNRLGVLIGGAIMLSIAVAQAQTRPPSEPAAHARVYDMAEFCPTQPEPGRYMPARALTLRINGRVVLDCAMNPERRVTACQIAEESPPRSGFGEAALHLACSNAAIERGVAFRETSPNLYTADDGTMRARIPVNFNVDGSPGSSR